MIHNLFRRQLKTLNIIEIFQDHISHNLQTFQKLLPQKHIFPVLKSNAYGHGIREITTILKPFALPYIVVDSYYEALQIWKVHKKQHVLIIGYNHPDNYKHFDFSKTAVAVYDFASLQALSELGKKIRIHLKINTGLNRLGIAPTELPEYLEKIQNSLLELEGVYSHFADADNAANSMTAEQEIVFAACLDVIPQKGMSLKYAHLANTAGVLKAKDKRINAVRLGIGLYGYNPLSKKDPHFQSLKAIKPALRLTSTIVNTIDLKKGESVGYNGTFVAPQDMRIGVLPLGYYECFPRTLSNQGAVRVDEQDLPIVGRIHMNLTCIDLQDSNLQIGDTVEAIGVAKEKPNSIKSIAQLANTIPYEILVHISESIRRSLV